jgi:hypothetical protein
MALETANVVTATTATARITSKPPTTITWGTLTLPAAGKAPG